MVDQEKAKQILSELGVSNEEALIYMTLLKQSPLSTTQIGKLTRIPKTNIYRHIDKMTSKGLIEKVVGARGILIKEKDPELFSLIYEKKAKEVDNLKSEIPAVVNYFKNIKVITKQQTQFRYYEGIAGIKQLLWNTLRGKVQYGYSTLGRAYVIGEKFEFQLVSEGKKRKIEDRIIINDSIYTSDYLKKKEVVKEITELKNIVRVIPENDFPISNDIVVYNNIFAVSSWKEGEIFGFEVENKSVAESQKAIHKLLWKMAKPLEETGMLKFQ